jgi:hypothetical protein
MSGCLSLPLRLAGLLLLAAVLYVGWRQRDRIMPIWHRLTDRPAPTVVGVAGRPGEASLRGARSKIDSLNGWRADSVVLTASEMASLVGAGLDGGLRGELDSLAVTLGKDRITVTGNIRTATLPKDLLGPFAGALGAREPLEASGSLGVTGPGRAEWRVDAFQVRGFDFPRDMVPRIVRMVAGSGSDGALGIRIPQGIGGVRVHPDGVTLYPSGRQP